MSSGDKHCIHLSCTVKINQILMITVVITKEVMCFYESEPFLSDDNSITDNEEMDTNDNSDSYVINI